MQTPAAPKGTRDFYPEDMVMRNYVFRSWERTCRRYGFESYDGPMFEHLEVYTQKSGPEIEKQLYAFKDKGGRTIALRPELTPTLARMVAARAQAIKKPVRWYAIPELFRYERMQKGRLREFSQLNMDILGVADVSADAELIAAAVAMMTDLGFDADDFSILVSSRTLIEDILVACGAPAERFAAVCQTLDKRAKIPAEEFERELSAATGDDATTGRFLGALTAAGLRELEEQYPGAASVRELVRLFELLDFYGVRHFVEFDIGIVRGLAYYTGIVFEVFDKKRSLRAIAGGGRYDTLVSLYGGPETPAVGFAAGDVVLGELLREKGFEPPRPARSSVYIVSLDRQDLAPAIQLAQHIREAGISCEYSLAPAAVGKQMKLANAARSLVTVFAGGEEATRDTIRMKDMRSGEEQTVDQDRLVEAITNTLRHGEDG